MKAVRCGGFDGSSRGKDFGLPLPRRHRFLGRKPSEPCRGSADTNSTSTQHCPPAALAPCERLLLMISARQPHGWAATASETPSLRHAAQCCTCYLLLVCCSSHTPLCRLRQGHRACSTSECDMPYLSSSPITLTAAWPCVAKQLVPSGGHVQVRWPGPSNGPVGTGISRWTRFNRGKSHSTHARTCGGTS